MLRLSSLHKSWALIFLLFLLPTLESCDSGYSEGPDRSSAGLTNNSKMAAAQTGMLAPDFTLLDLKGDQISMKDFHGKVVLLNFWATWCAPCRIEMPAMEELYQSFDPQDFVVLAVSTDPQGVVVTKPFKEAMGLTFLILHDSDYEVGSTYRVRTLPMTFLIDRQGKIAHRIFGARDWNSLEARTMIHGMMDVSS